MKTELQVQNIGPHVGGKMAGSVFRYDLATKAQCVYLLLTTRLIIDEAADIYRVAPVTVRAWVHNYLESCDEYRKLAPGVMTVSKTLITGISNVTKAKVLLETQKIARETLNGKIGTRFYPERSTLTPEIINTINGTA